MNFFSESRLSESAALHVLIVAAASFGFESLFFHHSINLMDEGWPLHAAIGLHEGGTLYRDVFWVFPPGHLLPAWIAYGLDPPGVVLSRMLYGALVTALVVAIYGLGRRLMPPPYALLGALLLAFAGASAHRLQLVFGYRYLVFAILALLAFSQRLRTGDSRWSFVSGLCAGVALYFRLTPAFAVSLGIGVGIVAASRSFRGCLRDWTAYGVGLLLVIGPVIAWFAWTVGLETLWREVVVRPVVMTDLQSLPMPDLTALPSDWGRRRVMRWFVAWQFRLYLAMYAVYAGMLVFKWLRALAAGRRFEHPLLVATVIFGGVYFVRTLGRSDAAHLYSAIPPVCLMLAHALYSVAKRVRRLPLAGPSVGGWRRAQLAAGVACFGLWIYFMGSEVFLAAERRGQIPLQALDGRVGLNREGFSGLVDRTVAGILRHTQPGDRILDLTSSPLLHALTGRSGVGRMDVVIPGTFMTDQEEIAFVAHLHQNPPALVVWPGESFDRIADRDVRETAPRIVAWVRKHYKNRGRKDRFMLLLPRAAP